MVSLYKRMLPPDIYGDVESSKLIVKYLNHEEMCLCCRGTVLLGFEQVRHIRMFIDT